MSQRVHSQPQDAETGRLHLQELLDEALSLVDDLGLSPEIGARLQEVIDRIESYFGFDPAAG